MKNSTDIKNILSAIDNINSTNYAFHVYVPSLEKEIPFSQINTSQQKALIKSVIDSPIYNTEFIFTIRNIIKDNCLDKTINIDEFTLFDKLIISIALRSKSISSALEVKVEHEGTDLNHSVDLDPLLQRVKDQSIPTSAMLEDNGYVVTVSPPTIGREYLIERDIRSKNKKNKDIQDPEQIRDIVGEAFITELIKYIKAIEIPCSETDNMEIILSDLAIKDQIAIVEKLPVKILEKILNYTNVYNETVSEFTKISVPVGVESETNQVKYVDQEVQVNGNFFIIS